MENLKAGEDVYTVLRRVSTSGMFRVIDMFVIRDNEPVSIMAVITDEQRQEFTKHYKQDSKQEGFRISGCGMDMGWALVHSLSSIVFKEFLCIGDNCPSNDHVNGDKNHAPHKHSDGGYALKQHWI